MILLDTHIWVWWVHGSSELPQPIADYLQRSERTGLGVSVISCWEIAKLAQINRLIFPVPVGTWLTQALAYPGIQLLPLTPEIAVDSSQLPGSFHRDPADQLIGATARVNQLRLVTEDRKIKEYSHVQKGP